MSTENNSSSDDDGKAELIPARRGPGRPPFDRTAERKAQLFECLAQGDSLTKAARKTGVSITSANTWSREPGADNALILARQRHLQRTGAGIVYRRLIDIVNKRKRNASPDDDDPFVYPASVRAKVGLDLLRIAGHTEAAGAALLDSSRTAALHELTEEQLRAHISAAQSTLASLAPPTDAPAEAPDSPDLSSLL